MAGHLQKVRFAATEEAADPHALLRSVVFTQVGKIGRDQKRQALEVLAFAHERRELITKGRHGLVVKHGCDACLTVIGKRRRRVP